MARNCSEQLLRMFVDGEQAVEVKIRPRRETRWSIPGLTRRRYRLRIEGGNGEAVRKKQYRNFIDGAVCAARAGHAGGFGVDAFARASLCESLSRRSHVCGLHEH